MPYKRPFTTAEAKFVEGGGLASDLSLNRISFSDWALKDGWRRSLEAEAIREGWDYWRPNGSGSAANQRYTGVTGEILAIEEIKSPAGLSVIVAVVGSTIRAFNYTSAAWTQIGSGFSTSGIRRWQIVQLNGYAIFNNGVDLPVYWRIGDAAVTPLYQLRESGVASVGYITEYNGFLMAADITEVNESYMTTLMNSGSPYGLVPSPATNTSRTQYRIIWSNESDPTDWAAVVDATGTSGTPTLTLAWPMASFTNGMEITVVGGGPSGGNLVTTILTVVGTTLTLAVNLSTSITNEPVSATSALGSVVGYYDIQDDGSPILAMMPLQNRLVVYRTYAIFIGTYTGQTDFPFQFDRTYQGDRSVRYPYTLINVRGQYHVYAGAKFFYAYTLGTLEPAVNDTLMKCANSEFFTAAALPATIDINAIYAVDNGITNEAFFVAKTNSSTNTYKVLAFDYIYNTASTIGGDAYPAYAGATVRNPLAGNLGDGSELIFIFGDLTGNMLQYGRTSKQLNTMLRMGASWTASLRTAAWDFGDSFNEKDLRSYVPLISSIDYTGASAIINFSFASYTFNDVTDGGTLRTTSVINNTVTNRRIVPMWQRAMYHQIRITATVTVASVQPRFIGHTMEYDVVGTRSVTRKS